MQKSTRHCVTQPMYLKFLSLHSPSCSVLWLHLLIMRFLFRVFNSFPPFSIMFFPTFYLWPAAWNLVQLFHYRGLECKSSKSRNTWNNRWIWPWNTKQSRSRLTEFCKENALVIANTLFLLEEKTRHMNIPRWSMPKSDWLYSLKSKMEKLYTVSENKTGRWLQLRSWIPYCQIQT